jgi:predicted amidohydrolase YtcJ
LDNGINLALSTDGPVVKEINPWVNIETAISRKAQDGFVIGKDEKITLTQALHAYTVGSAIADNQAHLKGDLSKGKKADFIVLNQNPLQTETIVNTTALETWVNGKLKYKQ